MTPDVAGQEAVDVPDPAQLRDVRVRAIRLEAEGVVSVELVDPSGRALPPWEAGAHIDLVLPSGIIRQYSLCGASEDCYRIAVLREADGRGGSMEVHDSALVGRTLKMRGPRNHFPLEPAPSYLFIAGGIGVTPILAMARSMDDAADYRVVYGGRTRPGMALLEELKEVAGDRLEVAPQDEVGLIDLDRALREAKPGTAVYCCGPAPLLEAVENAVEGLPDLGSLHVERFAAAPGKADPEGAESAAGGAFEVELAGSGEVLEVGPDDNLMEVIRAVRPDLLSSCEEGFCGTCETKVLAGEPEHHDTILSERERAEGKSMMICVGRSKSPRLVLDL